MTPCHRQTLRSIMCMAWDSRRAEPTRSFADCLRGAWRFTKRMAKAAKKLMAQAKAGGGYVRLSNDLTRSATKRKLIGSTWAGQRAYQACYGIAKVGR